MSSRAAIGAGAARWGATRARSPLIIESLRLWQGMNETVEAETGFRQSGIMYLAETQAELEQFEAWLEHARQYQLDTRIISSAEAAELMPGLTGTWAGALYTASDGKAEPQKAAPAIAEAARRRGAAIVTQCAVRGIETAGGRVAAAVTEKGRIACASVVLAGGAWSRLFCGNLGIELPQLKVLAYGDAHRAARGRPGDLGVGRPVRLSQADGRRLHRRDSRGAHDRSRPRQFPAVLRLSAGRAAALEEAAVPRRPPLGRGVAHAAALGLGCRLTVRGRARARSGAGPVCRRSRADRRRRGFPAVPQYGCSGELGRHDRCHAGCRCR